jgi:hypothetical protein
MSTRDMPARRARAWLAAALLCLAPSAPLDTPIFRLEPNPPSAGQDCEVQYAGKSPQRVYIRIGDGDWEEASVGADGRFKIPKERLKPGINPSAGECARNPGAVPRAVRRIFAGREDSELEGLIVADGTLPEAIGLTCVLVEP